VAIWAIRDCERFFNDSNLPRFLAAAQAMRLHPVRQRFRR
jgi:hypothetical protein